MRYCYLFLITQKIMDMHEEILEDCQGWWWRSKMTCRKDRGIKCIRLTKLATQFWLTKDLIGGNIFIWGKEMQIWRVKDSMRILEGSINFSKDLIAREIRFWIQFRC